MRDADEATADSAATPDAGDTDAQDSASGGPPAQHAGPRLPDRLIQMEHRLHEVISAFEQTGNALAANTGRLVPA